MPQGLTIDEFRKQLTNQGTDTLVKSAKGISLEDFRKQQSLNIGTPTKSPAQVPVSAPSVPPAPAKDLNTVGNQNVETDSLGDPWTRGFANLVSGTSNFFYFLDGWARDIESATGLSRGGAFENASTWLQEKAQKINAGAKPATGSYSKPPENILGYLDPTRMYKVAAENVPLMGAFLASMLIHKGAGTAMMLGVEGGDARRELDDYEVKTGEKVSPTLKFFVPTVVGAVNAALERTGLEAVIGNIAIPGLKSKLAKVAIGSLLEGTTEGAQEITQVLGQYAGTGKIDPNVGERFIESFYAGTVLGLAGSGVAQGLESILPEKQEVSKEEVNKLLNPDKDTNVYKAKETLSKVPDLDSDQVNGALILLNARAKASNVSLDTFLEDNGLTFTFENPEEAKDALFQTLNVFHGTSAEFDAYDLKFIGTGEGAQAFGHGMYFTTRKGIAKTYALQDKDRKSREASLQFDRKYQDFIDAIYNDKTEVVGINLWQTVRHWAYQVHRNFKNNPNILTDLITTANAGLDASIKNLQEDIVNIRESIKAKDVISKNATVNLANYLDTTEEKAGFLTKQLKEKQDTLAGYQKARDTINNPIFKEAIESSRLKEPKAILHLSEIDSQDPEGFRWIDWDEPIVSKETDIEKIGDFKKDFAVNNENLNELYSFIETIANQSFKGNIFEALGLPYFEGKLSPLELEKITKDGLADLIESIYYIIRENGYTYLLPGMTDTEFIRLVSQANNTIDALFSGTAAKKTLADLVAFKLQPFKDAINSFANQRPTIENKSPILEYIENFDGVKAERGRLERGEQPVIKDLSKVAEALNTFYSEDLTGEDFYKILSRISGGPVQASRILKYLGIDGIRYEPGTIARTNDQFKGDYNFVLFDTSLARIIDKEFYQKQNGEIKGSYVKNEVGRFINLFNNSDVSTVIHELGHFFRDTLTAEELAVATELFGVKKKWTRASEEKFAKAFENWFASGKTQNPELINIFEKFKNWIREIYEGIKGSPIKKNLDPKVEAFFESLFTVQPTIPEFYKSDNPTGAAYDYGMLYMQDKDVPFFKAKLESLYKENRRRRQEILSSDLSNEEKFNIFREEHKDSNIQYLREALEVKIRKSLSYNPEKGLVESPMSEDTWAAAVEHVSGMNYAKSIEWAKKQVNANEWIAYFKGEGLAPDDANPPHNLGDDIRSTILGSEPPNGNTTDEQLSEVEYSRKKHLPWLLQKILGPEFLLKRANKENATKDAARIIEGELKLNHIMGNYDAWLKKLGHKTNKAERVLVNKAINLFEKIKAGIDTKFNQSELEKLYALNPNIQRIIEGKEGLGGIIAMFEYVKKRFQDSLRERFRPTYTEAENNIIDSIIELTREKGGELLNFEGLDAKEIKDKKKSYANLIRSIINNIMDVGTVAREAYDRKNGRGAFDSLTPEKQTSVEKAYVRNTATRLIRQAKEITDVDTWTMQDYVNGIETGNYQIVGKDGKYYGSATTVKEAKQRAFNIRKELNELGENIKLSDMRIEAGFTRIQPTSPAEGISKDSDIMEVLPKYIYALERKIIFDPIIAMYKQHQQEFPNEYTPDVKSVIQEQLNYVMGHKYSWGDRITDNVTDVFGWRSGLYSRVVAQIRKYTAFTKLGYRPAAALVNALGGFGNTWVAVGTKFWIKGTKVWQSGKYTAPNGEEIDFAKKIKEIEEQGLLGLDFAVTAEGEIKTRVSPWHPLGLFQYPETKIRPQGFAANYVYLREMEGLDDFEATEGALQALRFQNFAYNLSSLPLILRSPTGKLVGQFRSYLIFQLQYLSTLRGRQIPRMLALQLTMAGPRGFVYLLRSLPILGALGLIDDLEEWLVRHKGTIADVATRGIGGLVGGDISAPATFQLPNEPEDWAGPALKSIVDFYKDVAFPAIQKAANSIVGKPAPDYVTDQAVDWVEGLSPLMYYWKDLYNSTFTQDYGDNDQERSLLERLQKPNVWVRDSRGNKAYKVGGIWDRVLLLNGITPIEKSRMQVLKNVWLKDRTILRENRTKWYDKVTRDLIKGKEITPDLWQDGLLYKIDPNQIPRAIQYKEMTPAQREILKTRLFDRADALDYFNLETNQ